MIEFFVWIQQNNLDLETGRSEKNFFKKTIIVFYKYYTLKIITAKI